MGVIDQYWVYTVIVIILMVSPGPAVVLAITNGMLHGPVNAFMAILGNMTGFLIISSITVASLGVVIEYSTYIFSVVKWLGGSYLIYLGIRMWLTKKDRIGIRQQIDSVKQLNTGQLYRRGLIVTLSNPKAIGFVVAIFPQFVNLNRPLVSQYLVLAITMILIQGLVLLTYAYLSSQIRVWLNSPGRLNIFNRTSGTTFIGFGLSLFLS
ncbi:MAG: LysE family translocator [Gammaproteobacteria bacterium]|nr:LysE family translocator [Gammaproteobacteria bacterium]